MSNPNFDYSDPEYSIQEEKKFDNIPMIEQPEKLKTKLYIHQLASVYAMEKLEESKLVEDGPTRYHVDIGINADMTGYGKTVSMVALVLRDKMTWDIKIDYALEHIHTYASQHVKKIYTEFYPKINTTLVLASHSIIHQWENEFLKTNLQVGVVKTKKAVQQVDVNNYDVIIVSSTMCNLLLDKYWNVVWKRFIYDEPTTLRIPSMKRVIAGFTWLITATPDDIYPNYRSTRRNYMSEILGDRLFHYYIRHYVTIKNDDNFVRESFKMPETHQMYHNCQDKMYRAVNGLVNEKISKMIEAGHILGAVQALGGQKTDNIVDLVKKNKMIELEEIKSKIKIWKLRGDEEKIKEWESKEKSVCFQIRELEKRFADILQSHCSICYEQLNKPIMEPSCQNIFCGSCLLTWLNSKGNCPLCRRYVEREELVYIQSEEEKKEVFEINEEKKILNKEETIIKIIKDNKEGRFIIFSEWSDTFDIIRNVLKSNELDFVEIKGAVDTRKKHIENFQKGKVNIAFLNSRTDSSGINMQETTDIILYHSMDESIRQQIMGRANRIGRKVELRVHHLLSV